MARTRRAEAARRALASVGDESATRFEVDFKDPMDSRFRGKAKGHIGHYMPEKLKNGRDTLFVTLLPDVVDKNWLTGPGPVGALLMEGLRYVEMMSKVQDGNAAQTISHGVT